MAAGLPKVKKSLRGYIPKSQEEGCSNLSFRDTLHRDQGIRSRPIPDMPTGSLLFQNPELCSISKILQIVNSKAGGGQY